MSRKELNTIQSKLKTAIQNHQSLVIKMKKDNQNPSLKKGLVELQEEIKKLSEEQKKIVVKLRESLVKSSSQQPQVIASTAHVQLPTIGPGIAAIGQPRLVSFPTQGGATILPVGMVAVPIAQLTRPTLGVAINSAQNQQIIRPADFTALATGNIPTAVIAGGTPIQISNLGSPVSIGNIIASNVAVSSVNPANLASPIGGLILNANPTSCVVTFPNDQNTTSSKNVTSKTEVSTVASTITCPSTETITSSTNQTVINSVINAVGMNGVSTTNQDVPNGGAVIMSFPQQPLVQPQLLHQQQQQILQMIQHQQQQTPQQRLASQLPIKVPQYTASTIKPGANCSSVQCCTIAPSPRNMSTLSTTTNRLNCSTTVSAAANSTGITNVEKTYKNNSSKPKPKVETNKDKKQQESVQASIVKSTKRKQEEKIQFMKMLGLYTKEHIQELQQQKSERKRRTTANPNYSFPVDPNKRRNGSVWEQPVAKKAKVKPEPVKVDTNEEALQREIRALEKDVDDHDDFCAACAKGGQLLMCSTCQLVYHLDCLKPPLTEAPNYNWSCPKCLVSGKGSVHLTKEALTKVHSYIAKKTSKEEERKKLRKKFMEMTHENTFLEKRKSELVQILQEQDMTKKDLAIREDSVKLEASKISEISASFQNKEVKNKDQIKESVNSSTVNQTS